MLMMNFSHATENDTSDGFTLINMKVRIVYFCRLHRDEINILVEHLRQISVTN